MSVHVGDFGSREYEARLKQGDWERERAVDASLSHRVKGQHTGHPQKVQSIYGAANTLYEQHKYREGEQLVWEPLEQLRKARKTENTEDFDKNQHQSWHEAYKQLERRLQKAETREEFGSLQTEYALVRLLEELSYYTQVRPETLVYTPSPLPRERMQPTLSAGDAESISPTPGNHQQEYEHLFAERPRGLNKKSAWLRQLRKQRGKEWYSEFFNWYTATLCSPEVETVQIDISSEIDSASRLKSWHPTDLPLRKITRYLSNVGISTTPDLALGRYNDHSIGVVVNGSALDPPEVSMDTFTLLDVQYAHLPIFAGLRFKESKDDLCLLILGNVYASSKTVSSDDSGWFDTRFVLALDTARHQPNEFLLVYKYEVHSIDCLDDDGSEERSEKSEHEEPPRFCNGSDAFTIALLKTETTIIDLDDGEYLPNNIRLSVRSVTKPDVAVAGFVDDKHPYIPVFPSRDN